MLMAMYLKEKIETFSLKTPYCISHNANQMVYENGGVV